MATGESQPTPPRTPEPIPPTGSESSPSAEPHRSATPEPAQSAPPSPLATPKTKVVLDEHGATARIRNPWLVALFCFITLGIYYLFWYYFVNREMADYGEANKVDLGHSPGMSVVAITIGAFIIVPPFVSIFRTGSRMRVARRVAGRPGGSPGIFLLLSILPLAGIFAPTYLQSQLNGAWERLPAAQF